MAVIVFLFKSELQNMPVIVLPNAFYLEAAEAEDLLDILSMCIVENEARAGLARLRST